MSESFGGGGCGMSGMGLPKWGAHGVGGSHGYAKRDMDKPKKHQKSDKAKSRRRMRALHRVSCTFEGYTSFKVWLRNSVSRHKMETNAKYGKNV